MDDAFLVVVVTVSLLGIAGAIIALATSAGAYDGIGRGDLSLDDATGRAPESGADVLADTRGLVEAANVRRIARGEPPLDVDAEVMRRLRDE